MVELSHLIKKTSATFVLHSIYYIASKLAIYNLAMFKATYVQQIYLGHSSLHMTSFEALCTAAYLVV